MNTTPMTQRDRRALRERILHALNGDQLPIAAIVALTGMSLKRVYRELCVLQETRAVVRSGFAQRTRYGLPGSTRAPDVKRWIDGAINPKAMPDVPVTVSWWITGDFAEAARREEKRLAGSKFGRTLPVSTIA